LFAHIRLSKLKGIKTFPLGVIVLIHLIALQIWLLYESCLKHLFCWRRT